MTCTTTASMRKASLGQHKDDRHLSLASNTHAGAVAPSAEHMGITNTIVGRDGSRCMGPFGADYISGSIYVFGVCACQYDTQLASFLDTAKGQIVYGQ
jgi:hypothetical protein